MHIHNITGSMSKRISGITCKHSTDIWQVKKAGKPSLGKGDSKGLCYRGSRTMNKVRAISEHINSHTINDAEYFYGNTWERAVNLTDAIVLDIIDHTCWGIVMEGCYTGWDNVYSVVKGELSDTVLDYFDAFDIDMYIGNGIKKWEAHKSFDELHGDDNWDMGDEPCPDEHYAYTNTHVGF